MWVSALGPPGVAEGQWHSVTHTPQCPVIHPPRPHPRAPRPPNTGNKPSTVTQPGPELPLSGSRGKGLGEDTPNRPPRRLGELGESCRPCLCPRLQRGGCRSTRDRHQLPIQTGPAPCLVVGTLIFVIKFSQVHTLPTALHPDWHRKAGRAVSYRHSHPPPPV